MTSNWFEKFPQQLELMWHVFGCIVPLSYMHEIKISAYPVLSELSSFTTNKKVMNYFVINKAMCFINKHCNAILPVFDSIPKRKKNPSQLQDSPLFVDLITVSFRMCLLYRLIIWKTHIAPARNVSSCEACHQVQQINETYLRIFFLLELSNFKMIKVVFLPVTPSNII